MDDVAAASIKLVTWNKDVYEPSDVSAPLRFCTAMMAAESAILSIPHYEWSGHANCRMFQWLLIAAPTDVLLLISGPSDSSTAERQHVPT